jgi:ubiquinone/menaquinone biosynthesis C-methylase UbiE
MAEAGYIHGGTDSAEVARLEKQARFCAPWIFQDLELPPGTRVLDLATGVGAMAGQLLQRFPGIHLVGVDLSAAQLAQARKNHPEVPVLRADGARLPFPDATFDRVHCSWMLEHLKEPLPVLREVHRVLMPGGHCHFTEVDNSTFRSVPEFPEVVDAIAALNAAQQLAGGDPYVGPKVAGYFAQAGFSRSSVRHAVHLGKERDTVFFQAFIDEFAEIFEGVTKTMPAMRLTLEAAAGKLRAMRTIPGASLHYTATVAKGFKDQP